MDVSLNPIQNLLVSIGVPWLAPRQELERRFGIVRHPAYGWDIIEIDTPSPLVEGLISPLSFNLHQMFAPHLPVIHLSGHAWFCDDARKNLLRTEEQLTPLLGQPVHGQNGNTLSRNWRSGASSLNLTVWPADMQSDFGPNRAHQRDPRLSSACNIAIQTGFRLPVSPSEHVWLSTFVGIDALPMTRDATIQKILEEPASEYALEFVRTPISDWPSLFGRIGISKDGEALIFCSDQLYLIPVKDITGFHANRFQPAKGPGFSNFCVTCRNDFGEGSKTIHICDAPGPDDLNELTKRIAQSLDKPFKLRPNEADC